MRSVLHEPQPDRIEYADTFPEASEFPPNFDPAHEKADRYWSERPVARRSDLAGLRSPGEEVWILAHVDSQCSVVRERRIPYLRMR